MNAEARRPSTPPPGNPKPDASLYPVAEYTSLPASVLWCCDRRMEGEAYLTGGYATRLRIENSGIAFSPLRRIAEIWQPGRLKGVTVRREHGIPFLTATQVFDARPSPRKWLAPARTDELSRRRLDVGWILVTCSGNVGDTTMSYSAHVDALVSHDLLRVQVGDDSRLAYVYAFLRSRAGRDMMRSSQYGSIIKHLEPEHLQALPIPTPSDALCGNLKRRVAKAFCLRDEAYRLAVEAENLFGQAVGECPSSADSEVPFSTRAGSMFVAGRRLDGYHYNPQAAQAEAALRNCGMKIVPLGEICEHIFGVPRFKHIYTSAGTAYLDSEDLFKLNPELTKFIPSITKREASTYFVEKGWVLMACSGQLYGLNGGVTLATAWHERKIVSNHVMRLVPRESGAKAARPGYVQVALGHPTLGRPLVLRWAFGTEVPEIAPDGVARFPLVRLGPEVEGQIADRTEQASRLRMEANREEDAAVADVEAWLAGLLPGIFVGSRAVDQGG